MRSVDKDTKGGWDKVDQNMRGIWDNVSKYGREVGHTVDVGTV